MAAAVAGALRRRPGLDAELAGFVGELLTGAHPGGSETDFTLHFAQVSAPVMAKGVEDTAFYRYLVLASLCEVGGDPGRFGRPVEEFHEVMAAAARQWPEAMLTLSTHDTKRSGDVRARLSLLAEVPSRGSRQPGAGRSATTGTSGAAGRTATRSTCCTRRW